MVRNIEAVAQRCSVKKVFLEISQNSHDVAFVAETKIDSSFPTDEFSLEGYHSPYRLDVSNGSDGLLVYINASIPIQQLNYEIKCKDIQIIPFEINLTKEK